MAIVEYMNRVCTVLCLASIYLLVKGKRNGGGWTPAEVAASVALASSLAWILLVPLFRFWSMVRSERRRSESEG